MPKKPPPRIVVDAPPIFHDVVRNNQALYAGMAPQTKADELAMRLHHLACEGYTEVQLLAEVKKWCKERTGVDTDALR